MKKQWQLTANKNWADKNKAHSLYLKSRTSARSFIRNKALLEDLNEFEMLIDEKRKELKMRAIVVKEISKHEELTMDVRQLNDANIELAKKIADGMYNGLSAQDKMNRLFEVRIVSIREREDEPDSIESKQAAEMFDSAGLIGMEEDWERGDGDCAYYVGIDPRR